MPDRNIVTDHESKAEVLWHAFKQRLGITEFTEIQYNLAPLLQEVDLSGMDDPFTMEEITSVLKDIPLDHALGPDGFNGMFFKRCWSIIKEDIVRLCSDFAKGHLDLQSINNSWITLIPKIPHPVTVNDFRPISLLNLSFKFLTKLLANRLKKSYYKWYTPINMVL